ELDREQQDVAARLEALLQDRLAAEGEKSRLEQQVEHLTERREQRADDREQHTELLRGFAGTGLLRVALLDLPDPDPSIAEEWSIPAALTFSRAADQQLAQTDEPVRVWTREQQRVSNAASELSTQMSRQGHSSFVEQRGDVLAARVRFR